MMHERKHCRYCKDTYSYQRSGQGCGNPLNNQMYCPKCMDIINRSLEEQREIQKEICFLPVKDMTEEFYNNEKFLYDTREDVKAEDNHYFLRTHRFFVGLMDMATGKSEEIECIGITDLPSYEGFGETIIKHEATLRRTKKLDGTIHYEIECYINPKTKEFIEFK